VLIGVGAFVALVGLAWGVFALCAVAVRAAGGDDQPLLAVLAETLDADYDRRRLQMVVEHFWMNRKVSRIIVAEPTRPLMSRFLAKLIQERLTKRARNSRSKKPAIPIALIAAHLAEAQLGLVAAWLSETGSCDASALADTLHASTNAAASALL